MTLTDSERVLTTRSPVSIVAFSCICYGLRVSRGRFVQHPESPSSQMIQKPSTYFPFDGTCKCSRNGDVILKFDYGAYLKTHSAVLKISSSVFDSMLSDCTKTKELKLEKTSRETWVHILNHLHPAATLVFSSFDPANNIDQLVRDVFPDAESHVWYLGGSFGTSKEVLSDIIVHSSGRCNVYEFCKETELQRWANIRWDR